MSVIVRVTINRERKKYREGILSRVREKNEGYRVSNIVRKIRSIYEINKEYRKKKKHRGERNKY